MTGIYLITSPSDKVYIGQSRHIKSRWSGYKSFSKLNQTKLKHSFQKHTYAAHIFEIIHPMPEDCSQQILDALEIFYISLYKGLGYELLNLKGGGYRGKHSEETKNKIKEQKLKLALVTPGFKGKKHTEESKKQISETVKKRVITAQHRANISAGRKGIVNSRESIEKARQKLIGRKINPDSARRSGLTRTGKKATEEHKNKIRLALTGKKKSSEHIESMRQARLLKKIKQ
jgi:group I intron endonuclease